MGGSAWQLVCGHIAAHRWWAALTLVQAAGKADLGVALVGALARMSGAVITSGVLIPLSLAGEFGQVAARGVVPGEDDLRVTVRSHGVLQGGLVSGRAGTDNVLSCESMRRGATVTLGRGRTALGCGTRRIR